VSLAFTAMNAPKKKVIFIGWDAADWKIIHPLMDSGKMPNLQNLIGHGAMGRCATLHPPLSPMLWTSIATGKRPFKHGIHGFSEPTPDGCGVRPITNLSRTTKAIWNILNQNDYRSTVIGWWPSHPAEPINGVMISDHYHKAFRPIEKGWPMLPGTVHPSEFQDTLAEWRMHPQELLAPMIEPFLPKLNKIDQENDRRFSMLGATIAECVSTHAVATWLIDNQPWDFFAVYYDAIDHFCHGFMKYHPPRQQWVNQEDFELYSNVVAMAYQLHDMMLGTLVAKAGIDTTVILMSDHGFHSDHLRPRGIPDFPAGPAVEHSSYGIFVMSGPGVKRDELLFGVSVLDLTPTVLTLYDLPVGEDMDGRVVVSAFENPPDARFIPSWEEVPGNDGQHPAHARLDPIAAVLAMERLAALGYVEKPGEKTEDYVQKTVNELRFNLVEAYQDGNRHCEALEIARDLCRRNPDDQRYALKRFLSCQALGHVSEMREIVDDMKSPEPVEESLAQDRTRYTPAITDLLEAHTLAAEKRFAPALAVLDRLNRAVVMGPSILLQSANLLRTLGRLGEAEAIYERALEIDTDNTLAYQGLCEVALGQHQYQRAADAAGESLRRQFFAPKTHFLHGVALAGVKQFEGAAVSFRIALSQNPHFPEAHLRLARLLKFQLNDPEGAVEHIRWYRKMRTHRSVKPHVLVREPVAPAVMSTLTGLEGPLPPLGDDVLIVSSLPRSGTSMLMQMLHAGGMPVLTDKKRESDEDNPRGYFELEAVKKMFREPDWLALARGKMIKVVVPLISSLPPGYAFRVVLIERNYDEILASQGRMIERRGGLIEESPEHRDRLRCEYARLVAQAKSLLHGRADVKIMLVHHEDVIRNPGAAAEMLNQFAGGSLDSARMSMAVDRSLHRNHHLAAT
jgi:predicted AlkP superfamily phosphohydrolase/phosphomutase/tetratricopeptide (TPR) repeat protein